MNEAKTKIVQEQLALLGLYPGAIDGIWTPWLAGAMRRLLTTSPKGYAVIVALLKATDPPPVTPDIPIIRLRPAQPGPFNGG